MHLTRPRLSAVEKLQSSYSQ